MENINDLIQQYRQLTKGWLNAARYAEYAITHHSTYIEGSTLTAIQVTNLLENGKTTKGKPYLDHLMVSDHFNAIKFIEQEAKKKTPLSSKFISEISAQVMKNTGSIINVAVGSFDVSKGEYRKCGVTAGSRVFPGYQKVISMVTHLCNYLNVEMPKAKTTAQKLEISFIAQFRLVSIHPFGDGNGRTSRLLMNYIQLYYGLPMGVVFKQYKFKYIDAMELARKTDNLAPYLKLMTAQYIKFLKSETLHLKKLQKLQM